MSSASFQQNQTTPSCLCDEPRPFDIDAGTIRRVDWQELVPVTIFFRAFSASFKSTFLLLVALILSFVATFVSNDSLPSANFTSSRGGVSSFCPDVSTPTVTEEFSLKSLGRSILEGWRCCFQPFLNLVDFAFGYPVRLVLSQETKETLLLSECGWVSLGVILLVGVWCSLAISRTAVVRLTSTSRSSTYASMKFSGRRILSALAPVFATLLLIVGVWGCHFVTSRMGSVGEIIAPFVGIILLTLQSIIGMIVFAAPLCVAAVATDNCDGFDALSRGVSYLLQRPFFLILYVFLAILFTLIGSCCVACVAFSARLLYLNTFASVATNHYVGFFVSVLMNLPLAYAYVSSIVYSGAIYILLRRSVDGTPFDSCVLNLNKSAPRQLRKILKDAKGAPTFDVSQAKENGESNG